MMVISQRDWQVEALAKFQLSDEKFFLLDATPGSGKTLWAALVANYLFEHNIIDFVIIVVPTTAIKGDKDAGFLGDWNKAGIQIVTELSTGEGAPRDFRGAVITYSQLPNMVSTIRNWGRRFLLILDEIHHPSENNVWGDAAEEIGRVAVRILGMTGTCFRSDKQRMLSFVNYDSDGKSIADHTYSYREAVRDRVCRKVEFITDDSETLFMIGTEDYEVRVSEAEDEDDLRGAILTVFRSDNDFLPKLLEKADAALDQYRTWDPDAGGLIICPPGMNENESKYLDFVTELASRTFGEKPESISYSDKDANKKIEQFRKSHQKWICAVRKISEGVDIKRLRVLVIATHTSSELLFRQLVGRIVRVDDKNRPGDATVFMAKFPKLVKFAEAISKEAEAGLAEKRPSVERKESEQSDRVTALSATHEDGGAISDYGDVFSVEEINTAERFRNENPQYVDISVTTLAGLMRAWKVKPEVMTTPEVPLLTRKENLRKSIAKNARRLAIERNEQNPDYKRPWREIRAIFGPNGADDLMNNYSIEVMRQINDWILATIIREKNG